MNRLDGWSYMMRSREKDLALVYFENGSVIPTLTGFIPDKPYSLIWYDPQKGVWGKPFIVRTDYQESLTILSFPDSRNPSVTDLALKVRKLNALSVYSFVYSKKKQL